MNLNLIITQLRTYCPSFADVAPKLPRVAGAAEFKQLQESQALTVPAAFVIPLEDNPEVNTAQNAVRQHMTDSFAVVVALSNRTDERGQAATASVHTLRAELFKALLGWQPTPDYGHVVYEGGSLLDMDRARLWYRFEFGAPWEIGPEDGWEQDMLDQLPKLNEVRIKVDVINPIAMPAPGPDGRIEFEVRASNLNP